MFSLFFFFLFARDCRLLLPGCSLPERQPVERSRRSLSGKLNISNEPAKFSYSLLLRPHARSAETLSLTFHLPITTDDDLPGRSGDPFASDLSIPVDGLVVGRVRRRIAATETRRVLSPMQRYADVNPPRTSAIIIYLRYVRFVLGCRWNNETTVAEGQTVTPDPEKEPCTQCQCTQGSMVCTRQTCPVLPCPANKALLQPGACCPVCQGM